MIFHPCEMTLTDYRNSYHILAESANYLHKAHVFTSALTQACPWMLPLIPFSSTHKDLSPMFNCCFQSRLADPSDDRQKTQLLRTLRLVTHIFCSVDALHNSSNVPRTDKFSHNSLKKNDRMAQLSAALRTMGCVPRSPRGTHE